MIPLACKKKDNPSSPASVADTVTFMPITTATPTNTGVNTSTPTVTSTATLSPTATGTPTFTNTPDPNGPTQLSVGDLVITDFVTSSWTDQDHFYFAPLKYLNVGTTIYMTDEGWDGSLTVPKFTTANTDSDGIWMWTATSPVPAGTQILGANPPSTGTVAFVFGNHPVPGPLKLSGGEDQVFLFQADSVNSSTGEIINIRLITGINLNITDYYNPISGSPGAKHSWEPDALNPILNGGISAYGLFHNSGGIFNGVYNCTDTSDTKQNLSAAVNNTENWTSGEFVPACSFDVD